MVRPYGQALVSKDDLDRCVAEIKLFPEDMPVHTFSEAHGLLEEAERVVFLGFGYYRINLERLQLDRMKKILPMFAGTAVGLEVGEKIQIEDVIRHLTEKKINLVDGNTLETLRNTTILGR